MSPSIPQGSLLERLEQKGVLELLPHLKNIFPPAEGSRASGVHRSKQRGSSPEFSEYRQYVQGEDLKRLDWRVYSKFERYFVRTFEDEISRPLTIALDSSASMRYAYADEENKESYSRDLAAALAVFAHHHHDPVGFAQFAGSLAVHLQPSSAKSHFLQVLTSLEALDSSGTSDFPAVLTELADRCRGTGRLVIISDFISAMAEPTALLHALQGFDPQLKVEFCQILTPTEYHFNLRGRFELRCLETGAVLPVKADDLREQYQRMLKAGIDRFALGAQACGHAHYLVLTDQPLVDTLTKYLFSQRRHGDA